MIGTHSRQSCGSVIRFGELMAAVLQEIDQIFPVPGMIVGDQDLGHRFQPLVVANPTPGLHSPKHGVASEEIMVHLDDWGAVFWLQSGVFFDSLRVGDPEMIAIEQPVDGGLLGNGADAGTAGDRGLILAFRAIVGPDRPDCRIISDFRKIHR
jgi:hypothetical protein